MEYLPLDDASLPGYKNGATPPPNGLSLGLGTSADEEPDPGWAVRNFIYYNANPDAYYVSFAVQQIATVASRFCTANGQSPKDDWEHCQDVLKHGPDQAVRFKFDRVTHELTLNQTWAYSLDGVTETIFTSVGSTTPKCVAPKSGLAGDVADGNPRLEGYCDLYPGLSSVKLTGTDSNVHMEAGMECCSDAIEVAGTIVSTTPGGRAQQS
ncbi:hypothetical protein PG990_001348 [Apiospora arundinis]